MVAVQKGRVKINGLSGLKQYEPIIKNKGGRNCRQQSVSELFRQALARCSGHVIGRSKIRSVFRFFAPPRSMVPRERRLLSSTQENSPI